MNPLWLFLIIPCSVWVGFFIHAILDIAKDNSNNSSKK